MVNLLKPKISIAIVSDVVCPWCYVGKKRLELAMEQLQDEFDFEVSFKPFQLDASIPTSGIDQEAYFIKKFGSSDRMETIFDQVESVGQTLGIDFQFRAIPKAINTLSLHMVVTHAKSEGIQLAVKQALFEAYMVNPVDLTNETNIVVVMEKFGWSPQKTLDVLQNTTLKQQVLDEIAQMQQLGVNSVPFFIVNDKFGISGAQTPKTFVEAFKSLKPSDFETEQKNTCEIGEDC
jgi:predicted DsbA family dithiol-disulfide isomerase